MSVSLSSGLQDLSKELGETTVNQTTNRINHYNDAVVEFFNDRKWAFSTKKDTSLATISGTKRYNLDGITDIRLPGGIKEVFIGDDDSQPFIPIDYAARHDTQYSGNKFFYIDAETNDIVFLRDITTTGDTITIRYFHIPTRITDIASVSTFPVPDRYRKAVATLAASYVQYSRYLDAQGNRLFNMYQRLIGSAAQQQAERNVGNPLKINHPLRWRGFKRVNPISR
jgi:hypothetical protein